MSEWFENGQAVSGVVPSDRGFRYGDGLFETIAIRDGQARLWTCHAQRLAKGLARLDIGGLEPAQCREQLSLALSATSIGLDRAVARLVVTAGVSARGYSRALDPEPGVFVEIADSPRLDDALYELGADTRRCETRTSWQPALAGLKTLNRLDQVLARREWTDKSVFEGLMCDRDNHVICGTMSNVFIVTDKQIHTPLLDNSGVAGVMRDEVMHLCDAAGQPAREANIGWNELQAANEVFLTNSQFGIVPVKSCGQATWAAGDMTRELRIALRDAGIAEGPV